MNIFSSLFLIVLATGSVSLQAFFLLKKKEYKLLMVQLGILGIAIIGGIIAINLPYFISIADILLRIIPWFNWEGII